MVVYNEDMENYNFQETPNTNSKVIDTITLTANDYLSFPTFFVEKHKLKNLGDNLHARMYFDKNSKETFQDKLFKVIKSKRNSRE